MSSEHCPDSTTTTTTDDWQAPFLVMLPRIERFLRIAYRHLQPEARAEAVQEGVANCLVAFRRLHRQGRADRAFPTVLARFAVTQYLSGRRVGETMNGTDVMSPYAQRKRGFRIARLERFDSKRGEWRELLVEDRTAGPAETAATRIDFPLFLASLTARDRRIAETLADGETTSTTARLFDVSMARISQLRRELMEQWRAFVGEEPVAVAA